MRGKFIVLQGLDRCGKTTLAAKIKQDINNNQGKTYSISFPNRNSSIGSLINQYLTSSVNLSDQAIHLLFSANRWEIQKQLKQKLNNGINIICDRYYFSGVAYSAAKGLDYQWCMRSDCGILQPDLVIFLKADADQLTKRGEYGLQKYQKVDFQKKVKRIYERIFQNYPRVKHIDVTNLTLNDVIQQGLMVVRKFLKQKSIQMQQIQTKNNKHIETDNTNAGSSNESSPSKDSQQFDIKNIITNQMQKKQFEV